MKTVAFGELMLRLSPEGKRRLCQADRLETCFGGGEANVAATLAALGAESEFVSVLPQNALGDWALRSLRAWGVSTSFVLRRGDKMGIYFLEKGASQRSSSVLYDRAGSAFSCADEGDFDWEKIFCGADWFHFSGITPALSEGILRAVTAAARKAKELGLTVSCDLNYRAKLWNREKFRVVMSPLLEYADVMTTNRQDLDDIMGMRSVCERDYEMAAAAAAERFGLKKVAVTLCESIDAGENSWSAMLFGENAEYSRRYDVKIVDRVGGGDAFGGGLIYALKNGWDDKRAVEFAAACGALKQTVEGDFNLVAEAEVEALAFGSGAGRIDR